MEISPSYKNIQEIYPERKAVDILTNDFFHRTTQSVLKHISINEMKINQISISYAWLSNQKISRVETIIGFNTINSQIGEARAKEIYGSTFYARKKWSEEVDIPVFNQLPDLKIDYYSIE